MVRRRVYFSWRSTRCGRTGAGETGSQSRPHARRSPPTQPVLQSHPAHRPTASGAPGDVAAGPEARPRQDSGQRAFPGVPLHRAPQYPRRRVEPPCGRAPGRRSRVPLSPFSRRPGLGSPSYHPCVPGRLTQGRPRFPPGGTVLTSRVRELQRPRAATCSGPMCRGGSPPRPDLGHRGPAFQGHTGLLKTFFSVLRLKY